MTNIQAIEFNGSKILTTKQDNKIYFGIKSICENIGVDFNGQLQKIKRDEVLNGGMCVIHTPINNVNQDVVFLPLDYLNGFLFGISVERLKNEKARELLIKYKKECYQVLADYFLGNSPSQPKKHSTPSLPSTKELALMVVKAEEEKEVLQVELSNINNKVNLLEKENATLDVLHNINDNSIYGLQACGKLLSLKPNKFIEKLKELKYLQDGKILLPYQKYIDCGYFFVKTTVISIIDSKVEEQIKNSFDYKVANFHNETDRLKELEKEWIKERTIHQTYITTKGYNYFEKLVPILFIDIATPELKSTLIQIEESSRENRKFRNELEGRRISA